jgi:TolB protein
MRCRDRGAFLAMITRLFFLVALLVCPALAQRNIGSVEVNVDSSTVPVRVSANTPELNALVLQAFKAHGRYRLVASGQAYDIRFTLVGTNQVRVDISRGSAASPVGSEVATGGTARQALLKAADIAVAKTNGLGLRGFFSARLAFVGERTGKKELYVSDLFLGEAKQITNDRALVLTPRWSPDGSKLLFTSFFKTGFPDVFQYDVNSFQRTTFISFRGTNSGARYSPSGQQVAVILSGEGTPEIYVTNAQGRAPQRRTRSDAVKSSPCWSPDGSRLVFTMEPGPQLYVMSAGGGSPQRLSTGFSYAAEPDWSRVSNKIACTVRVSGGQYQIAVVDPTVGKASVVSKASFDGIEPSWLGDGRHVVYTARDRSTSVVCILDTETGRSTPITNGFGGPAMQASVWTP